MFLKQRCLSYKIIPLKDSIKGAWFTVFGLLFILLTIASLTENRKRLSLRHEDFDGMPRQYLQEPIGRGDLTG